MTEMRASSYLVLILTEREVFELPSAPTLPICQFHQFGSRIRAWAQNEDYRHGRRTFLEYHIETHMRRCDVVLAHDLGNVINDTAINAIYAKTA